MSVKKRNETVDLKLSSDETIYLTITIGNAQIGGNVLKLIGSDFLVGKGGINNLNLGLGEGLIGKKLVVVTNILDVNEQTNAMVATYEFQGSNPLSTVFTDKIDDDGDIFSLTVTFNFT